MTIKKTDLESVPSEARFLVTQHWTESRILDEKNQTWEGTEFPPARIKLRAYFRGFDPRTYR